MKPVSPALLALFETGQYVSCDLYIVTLQGGGTSFCLTSADFNVEWGGTYYNSMGPLIGRSSISQKTGLQVSQVKIDLYPTEAELFNGLTWFQLCWGGYMDGASVTIERAFAPNWQSPVAGTITMMAGRVGDVTVGRSKLTIEVNSWTEILTNQMPRQYYQSPCRHVLFDARCGVPRIAYDVVLAGSVSPVAFTVTNPGTFPAGWFASGTLTMLNGVAQGQTRSILASGATGAEGLDLQLTVPLTTLPAAGDVAQITPGCDKTMATCGAKFNNLRRFGGFPFIPAPEVAL